jgi:2'-5' RNA ligase
MTVQSKSNTKKPRAGTKADLQNKLNAAHRELDHAMQANAYLSRLTRAGLGRALGQSFDGKRNLYDTLGYKLDPEYVDYLNIYERDGLGTRVVDIVADETWRKHPVLFESEDKAEDDKADPGTLHESFKELADQHDLWAQFLEVDRMLGISRFSLLYLGLPGKPEEKVEGQAGELAYVIACDEGTATVDEANIEKNPESERFGQPNYYNIIIDDQGEITRRVHYSRVIHIKQGRQRVGGLGRVYGVPGLKNIINRLWDLEKVLGGGSEAFWKLIYQGVVLQADEGFSAPPKDSTEYEDMQDEWDEWEHNLRRVVRAQGLNVKELGGKPVDSREQFDVIVEYIAGAKGIPQRRLLGSERGQLASSQDDDNFMDLIDARRHNFAEPYILRPFMKRCDELGILDLPDKYFVFWPSLIELNDMQKMDLALKAAQAIATASGNAPEIVMPLEEFASRYMDYVWTPEQKRKQAELEERNRMNPPGDQGKNGSNPPQGGGEKDSKPVTVELNRIRKALETDTHSIKLSNIQAGHIVMATGDHWYPTTAGPVLIHNENENSAMVAFRIPPALRDELQEKYPFMSDETRDNLHITLAFLGDSRTLDMEKAALAVSEFAKTSNPIKTTLQGIARFVSGGEEDPIVATIDSPDLPEFRQELCAYLGKQGIPYHKNHGFIPHMTLAYIYAGDEMPIDTVEPMELNFSKVYLVDGGEWRGFNLEVTEPELSEESAPEKDGE